jgi:hypothetical protein
MTIQEVILNEGVHGRSICDAIIWQGSACRAVIEVKLEAPLLARQLKKYNENLRRKYGSCLFVVLSRLAQREQIREYLHRPFIDATWREVHGCLERARKHRPEPERSVMEDFMSFIAEEDQIPRSISRRQCDALRETFSLLRGQRLHLRKAAHVHDAFDAISPACYRLEDLASVCWDLLRVRGWTPFSGIYVSKSEKNSPADAWLTAGFYRHPSKAKNRTLVSWVSLELEMRFFPKPEIRVASWAQMKRQHPKYAMSDPWLFKELEHWTAEASRGFMIEELSYVLRARGGSLKRLLKAFETQKLSHYHLAQ